MKNHKVLCAILAMFACFIFSSCAATHLPYKWLHDAEESGSVIYGSWINIELEREDIRGELIAVTEDTLFVADSVFHAIAVKDILFARLVKYQETWLGGYTVLGCLSTISHGLLLIFTAPMWLIGGTIVSIIRSYEPIIDYPPEPLDQFKPFARYPQGIPPDTDRNKIKTKPIEFVY